MSRSSYVASHQDGGGLGIRSYWRWVSMAALFASWQTYIDKAVNLADLRRLASNALVRTVQPNTKRRRQFRREYHDQRLGAGSGNTILYAQR